MPTYEFIKNPTINTAGVSVEAVAKALERLEEKNGGLRPAEIVKAAKSTRSAMHKCFEWDDSKAGQKYRLHQARNLPRSIVIVSEERNPEDDKPARSHAFVKTQNEYRSTSVVLQQADYYAEAVSLLQHKVEGAVASLRELKRLAEQSDNADRLARINVALEAFHAASVAVRAIEN